MKNSKLFIAAVMSFVFLLSSCEKDSITESEISKDFGPEFIEVIEGKEELSARANGFNINSLSAPNTVKRNSRHQIRVNYTAPRNTSLVLGFQTNDGRVFYSNRKINVSRGTRNAYPTIYIPNNVPIRNNSYKFLAWLTNGQGNFDFNQRQALKQKFSVNVVR